MTSQRVLLKTSPSELGRGLKTLIICICICAMNPGHVAAGGLIDAPGDGIRIIKPAPVCLAQADAGKSACFTGVAGLGEDPVGWLKAVIQKAGRFFKRSNSAPSTLLILLIGVSVLSAFVTYFGIILLRIYTRDGCQRRRDKLNA